MTGVLGHSGCFAWWVRSGAEHDPFGNGGKPPIHTTSGALPHPEHGVADQIDTLGRSHDVAQYIHMFGETV